MKTGAIKVIGKSKIELTARQSLVRQSRAILLLTFVVATTFCWTESATAVDRNEFQSLRSYTSQEQMRWARASLATIPLHFVGGLNCSAVSVGPNGEALTNLHCIESCLVSAGVTSAQKITGSISAIHVSDTSSVSCAVKFGKDLKEGNIKVLKVFGPGWLSPRDKLDGLMKENRAGFLRLLNLGYEASGDLALIKLPEPQGSSVRISSEMNDSINGNVSSASGRGAYRGGDSYAFNISYPIIMRRLNPLESLVTTGNKEMVSEGRVSIDSAWVIDQLRSSPLSLMPEFLLPKGMMMSSLDAESGSSGSGVFNSAGELIGLVRSTWKASSDRYVPWTTQVIDLRSRANEIKAILPHVQDSNRCRRPLVSDHAVKRDQFNIVESQSQGKKEFLDLYFSGARLAKRAFLDWRGYASLIDGDRDPVVMPTNFLESITRHIELALIAKYADFIYYSDMGHGHIFVPEKQAAALRSVKDLDLRMQRTLETRGLKVLYHTAELFKLREGSIGLGPLSNDPWLASRYHLRNFVGVISEKAEQTDLEVHSVALPAYNTVRELPGYLPMGEFYISASHDGCFSYVDNGIKRYFDISLKF